MADTPGRNTRSRRSASRANTPLPALAAQPSHAYGAQGKAVLHNQINTTGPSLASAFRKGRPGPSQVPDPLIEEAEYLTQESPVRETTRPGGRLSYKGSQLHNVNRRDDLNMGPPPQPTYQTPNHIASVDDRSVTTVPGLEQYQRRDHTSPPRTRRDGGEMLPPPRRASRAYPLPAQDTREPLPVRVFLHTLPRWMRATYRWYRSSAVKLLSLVLVSVALLLAAKTAGHYYRPPNHILARLPDPIQQHIFHMIPSTTFLKVDAFNEWQVDEQFSKQIPDYNTPEKQFLLNQWLDTRLRAIEKDVEMLMGKVGLLNETIHALEHMLPRMLVVRKIDGQLEIPQEFWQALEERLSSGENAGAWQAFLQNNLYKLKNLQTGSLFGSGKKVEVISSERFRELVEENNSWMASRYTDLFRQMEKDMLRTVHTISTATAKDLLDKHPTSQLADSQLYALAKANHLHNVNEAMHSVNYFARGLGAVVDPYLTSPAQLKPQGNILAAMYAHMPWIPSPRSATVALERWNEAGDCWCAAPSRNVPGKAQITVVMPMKIFPDALIVEHAPATGTLDIGSAPKDMEVWAEAGSRTEAARISTIIANQPGYGSYWECDDKTPPTERHVCIGSASYDVRNSNWVQQFPLWMDSRELGLLTDKITIRVKANWGGDWTCLYRLRMTGSRLSETHQE